MVLLFFGPPGSGKGTQSKLITEWLHIPVISTGEIFRDEVAARTPLGRKAHDIMARGGLISDDIVNGMLEKRLSVGDISEGFLLDGYPRTIPQAIFIDSLLAKAGLPEPAVLHLDVPRQTIINRVSGRRFCPLCKTTYNIYTQPPLDPGVCDTDGMTLETREDDREEVVRERLVQYDKLTGPLIGYYETRDYLRLDGDRPPEVVAREVAEQLESRLIRVRNRRAS